MPATVRHTPVPPPNRPIQGWYLYRFATRLPCARHAAGCRRAHRGYIGISNEPWRRGREHEGKWWHRHACGWEIDEQVFATEADALEAERRAIKAELPLFNDVHNRDNPCRVFPGAADAPSAQMVRVPRAGRPVPQRRVPSRRRLGRVGRRTLTAGVSWMVLTVALWPVAVHVGFGVGEGARDAALGSVALVLAGWWLVRPKRAGDRKLAGVLAVVAAGWLAVLVAPVAAKHVPTVPTGQPSVVRRR